MWSSSLLVRPARSMSIVGRDIGARHAVSRRAPFSTKRSAKSRPREAIQEPLHGKVLQ